MPKKILIIDDDPAIVKYLKAVFSDNGYATCSASSSMEGLEELGIDPVCFVVFFMIFRCVTFAKLYGKVCKQMLM